MLIISQDEHSKVMLVDQVAFISSELAYPLSHTTRKTYHVGLCTFLSKELCHVAVKMWQVMVCKRGRHGGNLSTCKRGTRDLSEKLTCLFLHYWHIVYRNKQQQYYLGLHNIFLKNVSAQVL